MFSLPPILVLDVETTSENRETAGLVEIGAIWLQPTMGRTGLPMWFEIKCRPRPGSEIQAEALAVNGCDWLENPIVDTEAEAMGAFRQWLGASRTDADQRSEILIAGMNPGFDWHCTCNAWRAAFGNRAPFSFRTLDLHTLALNEALFWGVDVSGKGITSGQIYEMAALPPEPKPHRALCGALLEHHALWEMLHCLKDASPPIELGTLEAGFFPQP